MSVLTLHVLFGRRKSRYEGEYFTPEALEIADDATMEENPDWIEIRKEHHYNSKQFEQLTIVPINIDSGRLNNALNTPTIGGDIIDVPPHTA